MSGSGTAASNDRLTNEGLVVLATYVAGGANGYADTEDIAVAANRLAPGRFSWRKHRDQINIDTVRKRLWDATRESSGGLLVGSEKQGWLLTEAGLAFCEVHSKRLDEQTSRQDRFSRQEQSWIVRERARMSLEPAFTKWTDGNADEITPVEAERFFRIDDYVIGKSRAARLERAIQAFNADEIYGPAIREIARLVRER